MAALIQEKLGLHVELVKSSGGELSVQVDGRTVAKRGLLTFPSDQKCLEAVRKATSAA